MTERLLLPPAEAARMAVDVASDNQGADIVMLYLREVCDFTDYFVILTAESPRQMSTIAEDIEGALERTGATLHHREGVPQSGWVLLDFSYVIIHMFGPEEREFYRIEDVWSRAPEVVRIQ